jgi:hypothetical protein
VPTPAALPWQLFATPATVLTTALGVIRRMSQKAMSPTQRLPAASDATAVGSPKRAALPVPSAVPVPVSATRRIAARTLQRNVGRSEVWVFMTPKNAIDDQFPPGGRTCGGRAASTWRSFKASASRL